MQENSSDQFSCLINLEHTKSGTKSPINVCKHVQKTSWRILTNIDACLQHILKLVYNGHYDNVAHNQFQELMSKALQLVVRVIRDEANFLRLNKKTFPDDFLEHNLSSYEFWKDYFINGTSEATTTPSLTKIGELIESFNLFKEFYLSVSNVLSTWPIPIGFSYPRTSDKLDEFFDRIPTPPYAAHSLYYKPQLSDVQMCELIVNEYHVASHYLSQHLDNVRSELNRLLENKADIPEYNDLGAKIAKRLCKNFLPVEMRLKEFDLKIEECNRFHFGMTNLHNERIFASAQVMSCEQAVRILNSNMQRKLTKYLTEFYLGAKNRLSNARSLVRQLSCREPDSEFLQMKKTVLDAVSRWENTLDDAIDLNRNGVLEVVTNLDHMEMEINAFLHSSRGDF